MGSEFEITAGIVGTDEVKEAKLRVLGAENGPEEAVSDVEVAGCGANNLLLSIWSLFNWKGEGVDDDNKTLGFVEFEVT